MHQPISMIGLAHTCRTIRAEFRPWWMSQHRIKLQDNGQYFKTFGKQLVRSRSGHATVWDTLRIQLPTGLDRSYSNLDIDMTSVFRLKANHPNTKIILEARSNDLGSVYNLGIGDLDIEILSGLLDHTNPLWLDWVRSGIITQTRIVMYPRSFSFRVVVKYRYLEEWMSVGPCVCPNSPPHAGLTILGLDGMGLIVNIGVQY